jgi:hypothetical protein
MALDASLILGSQPIPQPQSPLDAYQKILALKNAQANQQQNAIALQSQQLDLQQKQQSAQQQQGVLAALQQHGGDVDKAIETLKSQGNPQAFVLAQHKDAAAKEALQTQEIAQKIAASKQKQQLENLDHVASLTSGILDMPPALQGITYQARRMLAIQAGFATPDTLPAEWNDQTAQVVKGFQDQAVSVKDKLAQQLDAAKAAEAARHNTATEEQAKSSLTQTAKRDEGTNAYRQLEALISQKRLSIEQQNANTGSARLGLERARFKRDTVSPLEEMSSGQMEEIKAMANGDVKLPPAGSRAPGAAAKREAAFELARRNGYDLTDALYKAKQDFKVGKDSGEVAGMTRVLGHLDRYQQNSDKLGVAPSLAVNVTTPGNAPLHKDVSAISEEFGKLVKGGVLTVDQSKDFQSGLLSSRPAVRNATINEIKELMGSQFEAKFQKFKTATGTDLNPTQFFDAATQKRLIKQGLVPGQAGAEGGAKGKTADPLGIR